MQLLRRFLIIINKYDHYPKKVNCLKLQIFLQFFIMFLIGFQNYTLTVGQFNKKTDTLTGLFGAND